MVAVVLRPFAFEPAVLQGEAADVGRDRDVLRFGKFELLNAKLRMGRLPGCRYIYYPERSSILGPKLTKVISRGAGNCLFSIGVRKTE